MYDNYDASEYFEVLNQIRETGQMNMFGAPKFLQETFGLSKGEALHVFQEWTKEFENG
jgi:hypothetical protein